MPETFLQGVADIDGNEYEVGPGSFMAFPTLSVPHHMRNPFSDDLLYFAGGENLEYEIAGFPKLGKRMLRLGPRLELHDLANAQPFGSTWRLTPSN